MRASARFDAHKARLYTTEIMQNLGTSELAADRNGASGVHTVTWSGSSGALVSRRPLRTGRADHPASSSSGQPLSVGFYTRK